ncbi:MULTISPECIES: hypothetical protein [unclassified Microbacterium]|uniref:hypothetical protein n=1 Tax=unclassified Microbacterium TaxID=2609290 RepID=UPI003870C70B
MTPEERSELTGVQVVGEVWRLVVVTVVAVGLAVAGATGSREVCSPIGASGNSTDFSQVHLDGCGTVVLSPLPFVPLALVAILLVGLRRVPRRAASLADATRILRRTGVWVTVSAVLATVATRMWLVTVSPDAHAGGILSVTPPFPLANAWIEQNAAYLVGFG